MSADAQAYIRMLACWFEERARMKQKVPPEHCEMIARELRVLLSGGVDDLAEWWESIGSRCG